LVIAVMKRSPSNSSGLVLLAMLVFILVTTLAASSLVTSYQQAKRREKEEELLFVGDQFRRAILAYYNTVPPGGTRSLPPSLDALLVDQRFPTPRQHLRRIDPDPISGSADWEPVTAATGIVGVRSRSALQPLKMKGFAPGYEQFENARTYSDWTFAIRP
jgi:type II secretory pathway pseudopilin PulG